MSQNDRISARLRWAELRFSIVGSLLSSPPEPGELTLHAALLTNRLRSERAVAAGT